MAHEYCPAEDSKCFHGLDHECPPIIKANGYDEPTQQWHEKLDAVLEMQSCNKHPDCVAEGCFNKIHHGVICRGTCEKLKEF